MGFQEKKNMASQVDMYKGRLVLKVYFEVEGVDFSDIFSPIAKLTSITLLLSLVVAFHLETEQMNIKTTFLHGDLEEVIYMK